MCTEKYFHWLSTGQTLHYSGTEANSLLPLVTSIYDFMLTVIGQSSLLTIFCCLKETVLVSTVGELFNEIMGNSSVKCVDYAN
jgi:hypothetical protein